MFCSLCKSSFSISHGGEYDVKRHSTCESHKKREQQKEMSKSFLISKEDSQVDKITAAEGTSVYHSVQHAQSYRSSYCGSKLAPVIYPDSEIAKKMSCGRTKAASKVTDVLAPSSVESCLRELRTPLVQLPGEKKAHTPFFSVASDASEEVLVTPIT